MQNANVLMFLKEFLQRLFTKSPKFFKVWTWISGALVLVTGIPQLISSLPFQVHIPDVFNERLTAAIAWSSRAALLMSLLTTQSKPVGVTEDGKVVKATDDKQLPFTAATELKSAIKHDITPVEVITAPPVFSKAAAPNDQELKNT